MFFNVAAILYDIILRPNFDKLTSEMECRHIYVHFLLIKVSRLEVLRVLIYLTCAFPFLQGGHLENRPKWRVGMRISSVNILIHNQGGPMNNVIPRQEDP